MTEEFKRRLCCIQRAHCRSQLSSADIPLRQACGAVTVVWVGTLPLLSAKSAVSLSTVVVRCKSVLSPFLDSGSGFSWSCSFDLAFY